MNMFTCLICFVGPSLSAKSVQSSVAQHASAKDERHGATHTTSLEEQDFPPPPALTQSARRLVRRIGRIIGMPANASHATTQRQSNNDICKEYRTLPSADKQISPKGPCGGSAETDMNTLIELKEGLRYEDRTNANRLKNFAKWNENRPSYCGGDYGHAHMRMMLCNWRNNENTSPDMIKYAIQVFCFACIDKNGHNGCGDTDRKKPKQLLTEASSSHLVDCMLHGTKVNTDKFVASRQQGRNKS